MLLGLMLLGAGCPSSNRPEIQVIEVNGERLILEVVRTSEQHALGLSGRERLPAGQGMLFAFAAKDRYGFWMKEMRFPLDIIWIEGKTIVGIEYGIPAPTLSTELPALVRPHQPVDRVLEVSAGEADRLHLKEGMKFEQLP